MPQNTYTQPDNSTHQQQHYPAQAWQPVAQASNTWSTATKLKVAVSAGLDVIDLVAGMIPGVGHAMEFVSVGICCAMWGKKGAWALLELIDVTGVGDAFVPTCSLIAWSALKEQGNA